MEVGLRTEMERQGDFPRLDVRNGSKKPSAQVSEAPTPDIAKPKSFSDRHFEIATQW